VIFDGHTHMTSELCSIPGLNLKFEWNTMETWLAADPGRKCVVMPRLFQFCDSARLNVEFFRRLDRCSMKSRVFPFLWIHPDQLQRDHFKQFAFSGFKFHPSVSQTTLTEHRDILALCEKHKKPVLVHCGRNEKSRIDYVLKVNEEYPDLTFICAHMGGLATDLIIRAYGLLLRSNYVDNIYLDTSGCFYPELIQKAVKLLGPDRILFGTDRPFHSYEVSLHTVNCCRFDRKTKADILSMNLKRVLSHT